jgi:uncharacterized protein
MTLPPSIDLQLGLAIPMPDGVIAGAIAYLPRRSEQAAALLCMTPYGTDYVHDWAMKLASSGYNIVVVDCPGRGESTGTVEYLNHGHDVAAAVAWVSDQFWCDGRVALFGRSYSGIVQWQGAALAPPGLVAIAPTAAPMTGLDLNVPNGVPRTYELRWCGHVHGRVNRRALFDDNQFWRPLFWDHLQSGQEYAALGARLGTPVPYFDQQVRHLDDMDFWISRSVPLAEMAAVTVPALTLTGTADNAHRGALAYHQRLLEVAPAALAAASRLVIGPWRHDGAREPAVMADEPGGEAVAAPGTPRAVADHITLGWFDHVLKGKPLPASLSKPVNIYIQGMEEWVHGESLAALQHRWVSFEAVGEELQTDIGETPMTCSFVYDPDDFRYARREATGEACELFDVATGANQTDHGWADDLGDAGAAWTSAALAAPLTILGVPRFSFSVALDGTDADLMTALVAELPNGDRLTLSADILRISRRHGRWTQALWLPGKCEAVRFPTPGFVARRLPAGARLKLILRSLVSISFQRPACAMANGRSVIAPIVVSGGPGAQTRIELPVHDPQNNEDPSPSGAPVL